MLFTESHVDVPTRADGVDGTMRIFLFHPTIPGYPNARFPAVVLFSEIYQVTGPVARFARLIAGQGYIVAAPSCYHDFTGPEALTYDVAGTDQGNAWKAQKTLDSYDEDSHKAVDYLLSLPTCTGRIGSTGMCLGGHLALRAALDPRVTASICFFGTDIHSRSLGTVSTAAATTLSHPTTAPTPTIDLLPLLRANPSTNTPATELTLIFGCHDTHVPPTGRDTIRQALRDAGLANTSFHEFAWAQHAFVRDELSKGRYDPAITKVCFEMLLELFGRTLGADLGAVDVTAFKEPEHVC